MQNTTRQLRSRNQNTTSALWKLVQQRTLPKDAHRKMYQDTE